MHDIFGKIRISRIQEIRLGDVNGERRSEGLALSIPSKERADPRAHAHMATIAILDFVPSTLKLR